MPKRTSKHYKGKKKEKQKNTSSINPQLYKNFIITLPEVKQGEIEINNKGLWTTNLSNGIYILVKTTRKYIGWHYSLNNTIDHYNMENIDYILKSHIKYSNFRKGWIIYGADRDEDFELRNDSDTIISKKEENTTKSRDLLWKYLDRFPWSFDCKTSLYASHYKDFIIINDKLDEPVIIDNDDEYDKMYMK